MIARTVLSLITEAYRDEFASYISKKFPDYAGHFTDLLKDASRVFQKTNQLNWFLRQIVSYMESNGADIRYGTNELARFEHYFSLPVDAIKNFSFGSLSIDGASRRLGELEAKWQERQSRLIPIKKAYEVSSYVVDVDEDEYEYGYKDSRTVEGEPEDIVTFPDGFRWVNLNVAYSEIEAKAMGHCGNEPRKYSKDTILSLRQLVKQGGKEYLMPHATFVLMDNGYLRELKGFQNHKLAPKYMPYVVELFKQYRAIHGIDTEDSYRPESDVVWDDFSREQLRDILRSNKSITDPIPRIVANKSSGEFDIGVEKWGFRNGKVVYKIDKKDTKRWYRNGELHRDDGPAMERADGTKMWYRNGLEHRDDGPAGEWADGAKRWYRNGELHRDDGPAIENEDGGTKEWYRNGKLHRDDGPAIEHSDGTKEWWRNGKLHRDDGPAIEWKSGGKMWWVDGRRHRDDGPAVEKADGTKEWYRNGKLHRDDGPAVMLLNPKYNQWYRDGQFYLPTDEEVARYEERIRRGEITE